MLDKNLKTIYHINTNKKLWLIKTKKQTQKTMTILIK